MLATLLDRQLELLHAERDRLAAKVRVLSRLIEQSEQELLALRCELEATRRELASKEQMIQRALSQRMELRREMVLLESELRRI